MSEPINNQEDPRDLNPEERRKFNEIRDVFRSARGEAIYNARVAGDPIPEALGMQPFERKALNFLLGAIQYPPATWSMHALRQQYLAFDEPLPAGAPEDWREARETAQAWIQQSVREREETNARRRDAGEDVYEEPGEVRRFVMTGEEMREEPEPRVQMRGGDPQEYGERMMSMEQGLQMLQQRIQQDQEALFRSERERRMRGIQDDHERLVEERALRDTEAIFDIIANDPDLAANYTSADEVMKAARGLANDGVRPVQERTGDERLVSNETREQTELLPDYRDEKAKLLGELNSTPGELSPSTPTWDEYRWSAAEGRILVREQLVGEGRLTQEVAEEVMAAALLHGDTLESFRNKIAANGLVGYLTEANVLKDDADLLKKIEKDDERREQLYEDMMVKRPGSFEDTVWQMAHAPGVNEDFQEGKAMALYRNVVVRKFDQDKNRWVLKTEQRVNTDIMIEWLCDRMLEVHGNNTIRALDFEKEVQITKSGMGLPISIYDMMVARTEKMFISKYLTDTNGNKLRFGWTADLFEAVTNIMAENRNMGIVIPQKMRGDIQELISTRLQQIFTVSNMTRDIGGTSLSESALKWSERGNGRHDADGKIGAAIDTAYVAYCSMYDLKKLSTVLGFSEGPAGIYELGDLFSLDKLRSVRDEYVRDALVKNKEKWRPEYADHPEKWLDLEGENATINGMKVKEVFNEQGQPRFLDQGLTPDQRADATMKFLGYINFLNNMTPDGRTEQLVKGIITARAAKLHGIAGTINGAKPGWRNPTIELIADGMMYRFGMYFHLDNTHSGRSEEAKLNAAFREHYNQSYSSGGNLFNLGYFPHSMLPESLMLRTRDGDVYQTVLEEAAYERAEISRAATEEANRRFNSGDLDAVFNARIKKIEKVRSMEGKSVNEKRLAAMNEVIADEVSRILTTSQARTEAERKFSNGELQAEYTEILAAIQTSDAMHGRSQRDMAEAAKRQILTAEEARLAQADSSLHEAPITPYNDIAQKMQFKAEAERQVGTENYKNQFAFARELAFKTLGLTESITVGVDGPNINLTKFMDSFSKRATELTKSLKGLDLTQKFDAWDEELGAMRLMTGAEFMIGKPILLASGMMNEDGTMNEERIQALQKKPSQIPRWMMSGLIAGEMKLYREWAEWNLSPRYSFAVTMSLLEAMSRIPGGKDPETGEWKKYFADEQIKWIRKESQTESWRMYRNEVLSNFFFGTRGKKDGLLSGLAEMFGIMFKSSFQGVVAG